jgi:hypothetical protein
VNKGTGTVKYDNYNGSWGRTAHLDKFMQTYGIEAAKQKLQAYGGYMTETKEADGTMQLVMELP